MNIKVGQGTGGAAGGVTNTDLTELREKSKQLTAEFKSQELVIGLAQRERYEVSRGKAPAAQVPGGGPSLASQILAQEAARKNVRVDLARFDALLRASPSSMRRASDSRRSTAPTSSSRTS